ncbi:protein Skeletor, isoforms B/C isoform X1 [Bradysia coprophila]|uniref:protein Skeletor, isoforms B/C isoform X1 n=1 Tax=Bradysia coprophila TaxID=38358 RepID=UPI00187D975C|nr:protein Skeletor, isoforms B/C isoform X1 [Bradysia coprophila]
MPAPLLSPSPRNHGQNGSVREIYYMGLIISAVMLCINGKAPVEPYYGRYIGPLKQFGHGIKGDLYAVDESTIFLKGFSYDGTGPDAFFWVGKTPRPSPEGYIIPYPEEYNGRNPPILQAYHNADIILRLPMGKRIRDIRWLSVWCRRFTVDFGEVFIPAALDVPKPRVLPEFKRLAHGLRSSNISVLDAKTFYIPNLHYDGTGPDAFFWVGNGSEPDLLGIKVPNELGSIEPLRAYQGEDIEIQLPGSLTVYDIDWLSVWSTTYHHNFGHVYIPKDLDVPPALGQTKISPPWWYNPTTTTHRPPNTNCRELLNGRLQIKWDVQGDNIQIELIGRIKGDQYMAFGISGTNGRPQMVGADIIVAYYDAEARVFRADDYYMSQISECDGKQGVCPDERVGGRNDVQVLTGYQKNGVTSIKFRRPLQTNEPVNDRAFPIDREVSVIAAIGPLNTRREANAHSHTSVDVNTEDIQIDFATRNDQSCATSLFDVKEEKDSKPLWPTRELFGETMITARIGPMGGSRGFAAHADYPSLGMAWYLNDMLVPVLFVERGQTYVFSVEGGDKPSQLDKFHPFYITDSPEGGFGLKSESEQRREKIYAGVEYHSDGYVDPTAAGRLCEWRPKTKDRSSEMNSFDEYFKTLDLHCEPGEPAFLNWTVAMDTPDLLYYQCFMQRNLGWKINVVNPGQTSQRNHSNSSNQIQSYGSNLIFSIIVTITISRAIFRHLNA